MSNFNKSILNFKTKGGDLTGFNKLIDDLKKVENELPTQIDKWVYHDAIRFAEKLEYNYHQHLYSLSPREKKFIHPQHIYITKIRGGYNVAIEGKDILYHEFGTGMVGREGNYPFKKALASTKYEYSTGPKIIHAGENLQFAPRWYVGMVTKYPERASYDWWMAPFGPTKGMEPGAFTYKTYVDMYDKLSSDDAEATKWSIGKQSVHLKVRNRFTKGKWN